MLMMSRRLPSSRRATACGWVTSTSTLRPSSSPARLLSPQSVRTLLQPVPARRWALHRDPVNWRVKNRGEGGARVGNLGEIQVPGPEGLPMHPRRREFRPRSPRGRPHSPPVFITLLQPVRRPEGGRPKGWGSPHPTQPPSWGRVAGLRWAWELAPWGPRELRNRVLRPPPGGEVITKSPPPSRRSAASRPEGGQGLGHPHPPSPLPAPPHRPGEGEPWGPPWASTGSRPWTSTARSPGATPRGLPAHPRPSCPAPPGPRGRGAGGTRR